MENWKLKDWLLIGAIIVIVGLSYIVIRDNTPAHVWHKW